MGEGVLAKVGNRSFIEGEGEGVERGGRLMTATLWGGGGGGGGDEPKSFVGLGEGARDPVLDCEPIFHSSVESGYGRPNCLWLFLEAGLDVAAAAAGGRGEGALIA